MGEGKVTVVGKGVVVLGGDHSIKIPKLRPLNKIGQ